MAFTIIIEETLKSQTCLNMRMLNFSKGSVAHPVKKVTRPLSQHPLNESDVMNPPWRSRVAINGDVAHPLQWKSDAGSAGAGSRRRGGGRHQSTQTAGHVSVTLCTEKKAKEGVKGLVSPYEKNGCAGTPKDLLHHTTQSPSVKHNFN